MTDAVSYLQDLIRCKTVTPDSGTAIDYLQKILAAHGFDCHRLTFGDNNTPDVDNLYARYGTGAPHLSFAGHVDVVPPGDTAAWSDDPFSGAVKDGYIWGRGAADMKGNIAAFLDAALAAIKAGEVKGSVSFLITGDEEGPAINGTKKIIDWLAARGEKIDFCLLGEPTSQKTIGDVMKVGRRGTLSGFITVRGTQGHVAYPHLADNPVPRMLKILQALEDLHLDDGSAHFAASNLEIVTVDVGNPVTNVIPEKVTAAFNVRFNDNYSGAALDQKIRTAMDATGVAYEMKTDIGGECFYTKPGAQSGIIADAIQEVTGAAPRLDTGGGTSDARFIKSFCPVIEFGLVGETMHKIDERIKVSDLEALVKIYRGVIRRFF